MIKKKPDTEGLLRFLIKRINIEKIKIKNKRKKKSK